MTKDTFHVGDLVKVLPYEQAKDHYCLPRPVWNEVLKKTPLTIARIRNNGEIYFEEVGCYLKAPALILHIPPQLVEVGDLL